MQNIGMHIGGGPNDDVTKAPFAASVSPHFPALAACWSRADAPVAGDFGVDLLVDAKGGRAEVTHPRSTIPGDAFRTCATGVFAAIDFLPPKLGTTRVSYSVRFTPAP